MHKKRRIDGTIGGGGVQGGCKGINALYLAISVTNTLFYTRNVLKEHQKLAILQNNSGLQAVNSVSEVNNKLEMNVNALLLLVSLLLKIFKEGWLFSCRCFSRDPPFKYILQLKRNKISIKNLITTATKVSEELYTIMKTKKQVIKVGC